MFVSSATDNDLAECFSATCDPVDLKKNHKNRVSRLLLGLAGGLAVGAVLGVLLYALTGAVLYLAITGIGGGLGLVLAVEDVPSSAPKN